MSDEPMNQDRRVKRTRQVIRDAFISLIGQKGFEAVTVQEITETADIHRSTFYFHYEDKYDLMKQINEEMFQAFGHALSLPEAEAGEQCRFSWDWALVRHFEHIADNADYYKVMLGANGVPCVAKQLQRMIEQSFYRKLVRMNAQTDRSPLDAPIEALSSYVASAHLGLIEWWLDNDLVFSPSHMAKLLGNLVELGPFQTAGMIRGPPPEPYPEAPVGRR